MTSCQPYISVLLYIIYAFIISIVVINKLLKILFFDIVLENHAPLDVSLRFLAPSSVSPSIMQFPLSDFDEGQI